MSMKFYRDSILLGAAAVIVLGVFVLVDFLASEEEKKHKDRENYRALLCSDVTAENWPVTGSSAGAVCRAQLSRWKRSIVDPLPGPCTVNGDAKFCVPLSTGVVVYEPFEFGEASTTIGYGVGFPEIVFHEPEKLH